CPVTSTEMKCSGANLRIARKESMRRFRSRSAVSSRAVGNSVIKNIPESRKRAWYSSASLRTTTGALHGSISKWSNKVQSRLALNVRPWKANLCARSRLHVELHVQGLRARRLPLHGTGGGQQGAEERENRTRRMDVTLRLRTPPVVPVSETRSCSDRKSTRLNSSHV